MDRNIVYPGSIPQDVDILNPNRNAMIALGWLTQATLGTNTGVVGLECTPTIPASMTVNVGAGAIWAMEEIDTSAYGSLAADSSPLMKLGILPEGAGTNFPLTAPSGAGQSINYLIEAAFQEVDANPVVLPYVNPSNPSQPYSGPSNSGTAQNTVRQQLVELQLKAGAAANTGTQATPATDAGYVPLYVITVSYGQSSITSANIVTAPSAPFVLSLPAMAPKALLVNANDTVSSGSLNGLLEMSGTANFATTIPSPSGIPGQFLDIWNNSSVAQTMNTSGGSFYGPGGSAGTSVSILPKSFGRMVSDGYNWILPDSLSGPSVKKINRIFLTSNSTYVPSAGLLYADVACRGGGGGAGSAVSTGTSAALSGGGGQGGYAAATLTAAQIGASQPVNIGTGGGAGTASGQGGSAGGATSFGSLVVALGGGPSGGADLAEATSTGGAGGAGTVGTTLKYGAPGTPGIAANSPWGGTGGGEGAQSAAGVFGTAGAAGGNAQAGSGAGGGGAASYGTTVQPGGTGGNGWVEIIEYIGS